MKQAFHIFEDIFVVPDLGPVSSPRVVTNRKHFRVHFRLVHLLKHVSSLEPNIVSK